MATLSGWAAKKQGQRFTDTWGNRFNGVWVYQPNTGNGDIYVTGVN